MKYLKMMKKVNEKTWVKAWNCHGGIGFPLLILVIGLYWFAKDIGWIQTDISFWPVLLIILGIYWIIRSSIAKSCNQ